MKIKLDLINKKILYELDRNSRIPITKLSKKLNLSKDRINYRIKNLQEKGIIKKFITQIDPSKFGYSIFKVFITFQNTKKEDKEKIINWLKGNKNIYWVAECQGNWEMNFAVFAKNIKEFDEIFTEFISKFGKFVLRQEINTTLKVGLLNKKWIYEKSNQTRKISLWGEKIEEQKIDKIDLEILKILANNSRTNSVKIAEKLKTTPRKIIYRIKEMEKKKIILGYSISLDYEKLKKQFFKANIYFNFLNKNTKIKIEKYCELRKNIIYYIFCIGNWPLEIEFNVSENKEFYEEMEEFKKNFPELKNYDTIFITKEHKFDWIPECYNSNN